MTNEEPRRGNCRRDPDEPENSTPLTGGNQPVTQRAECDHRQSGSPYIQRPGTRCATIRRQPRREQERRRGDWQVDEEDGAPANRVDEPPAERRSERCGEGTSRRPCADGGSARLLGVRGADDRQARRHQERGSNALGETGGNQPPCRRRHAARQRRRRESNQAMHEDAPPPEPITSGSPEEDKARQREHVCVDDPLHRRERTVQRVPHHRKGHVHDGAVDERQRRSENRGRQHPMRCRRRNLVWAVSPWTFAGQAVRTQHSRTSTAGRTR